MGLDDFYNSDMRYCFQYEYNIINSEGEIEYSTDHIDRLITYWTGNNLSNDEYILFHFDDEIKFEDLLLDYEQKQGEKNG